MISVPVTPVAKPRMVRSDKWKLRPAVMRYRDFCDQVRLAMPRYELPGCVTLIFFIPMPASWGKRKRLAMLGAPHTQKPDIDNLVKSWLDAWKTDDSHVYAISASKYWAEEGSIEVGKGKENDRETF